jgi:hypothetical protein
VPVAGLGVRHDLVEEGLGDRRRTVGPGWPRAVAHLGEAIDHGQDHLLVADLG